MDNQHRHIKGYRELSAVEIALMNKVKAHGQATEDLLNEVQAHLSAQVPAALNAAKDGATEEQDRIDVAQPQRWLAMARSDLQVGTMKLVRAVAQPSSF